MPRAGLIGFGKLITLRQLHLPVKIVVFNNGALSFEASPEARNATTLAPVPPEIRISDPHARSGNTPPGPSLTLAAAVFPATLAGEQPARSLV